MLYSSPVDIVNRGLQKVGARRIATFTDQSKNAQEASFVYDKLRSAELRAKVWRFATRKAPLRPIVSTTGILTPLTWLVGTTYAAGAVVADPTVSNFYWQSIIGSNTGVTPGTDNGTNWVAYFGPLPVQLWSSSVTYVAGDVVYVSGTATTAYVSLANANLNNAPASGAPWLSLGASSAATFSLLSPIALSGGGTSTPRSVYMLPNGFLRMAMQDPKTANNPVTGTSGGNQQTDWEFQGNFFTSAASSGLLIFRFVADVCEVPVMDDLFCEALAGRVALELCEPLTQSPDKKKELVTEYASNIALAQLINSIEIASTEPDEEDYRNGRVVEGSAVPARGGGGG